MNRTDDRGPHRGGGRWNAFLRRWRWHWVVLGVLALTLAGFLAGPAALALRPMRVVTVAAALPAPRAPEAEAATPVDGREPMPVRTVQAPGWLEAEPFAVAVAALADGVVAAIHVLEGQAVRAGDPVADLVADDAELAVRRAEAAVASAEAELRSAEADHASAQAHWNEPVERERQVAVSAAALAEAEAELAMLPSQIAEAEAALQRWQEEQARVESAFDQKAATERERLVARYETASRLAALEALRQRRPLLAARVQRLRAESEAARRAADLRIDERRELDRSAAAMRRAEAQLRHAKTDLAVAELRLQRMTITAPMDGYVLRRLKRPGDKVMVGADDAHSAHLVHLYDPQRMQVRVDVPLADAAAVLVGQACEVIVDVLPDETFAGEVTRITHEADLQKNTLQVKVKVHDPSPMLRPEMLARVRFLGSGETGGEAVGGDATAGGAAATHRVRVPESTLDGGRIWLVRHRQGPSGEASVADVRVVSRDDDGLVTVEGPVHVGDLVVRRPAGLEAGERVRVSVRSGGDA